MNLQAELAVLMMQKFPPERKWVMYLKKWPIVHHQESLSINWFNYFSVVTFFFRFFLHLFYNLRSYSFKVSAANSEHGIVSFTISFTICFTILRFFYNLRSYSFKVSAANSEHGIVSFTISFTICFTILRFFLQSEVLLFQSFCCEFRAWNC